MLIGYITIENFAIFPIIDRCIYRGKLDIYVIVGQVCTLCKVSCSEKNVIRICLHNKSDSVLVAFTVLIVNGKRRKIDRMEVSNLFIGILTYACMKMTCDEENVVIGI